MLKLWSVYAQLSFNHFSGKLRQSKYDSEERNEPGPFHWQIVENQIDHKQPGEICVPRTERAIDRSY